MTTSPQYFVEATTETGRRTSQIRTLVENDPQLYEALRQEPELFELVYGDTRPLPRGELDLTPHWWDLPSELEPVPEATWDWPTVSRAEVLMWVSYAMAAFVWLCLGIAIWVAFS